MTRTHLAISNAGQHVDMCTAPKLQETGNVIVKTEQAAPHIKALFFCCIDMKDKFTQCIHQVQSQLCSLPLLKTTFIITTEEN